MGWLLPIIYIIVAVFYGCYRQFFVPELYGYNFEWIWYGAIGWPYLVFGNILDIFMPNVGFADEKFIMYKVFGL